MPIYFHFYSYEKEWFVDLYYRKVFLPYSRNKKTTFVHVTNAYIWEKPLHLKDSVGPSEKTYSYEPVKEVQNDEEMSAHLIVRSYYRILEVP